MADKLIAFCSIAGIFSALMAVSATSLRGARTVYQLTDRLSWIAGGLLVVGIGFWRPWFTTSWWKAVLLAPLLCVLFAGLAQVFLGSLMTIDTTDRIRIASRLITLAIFLGTVFLSLRACG